MESFPHRGAGNIHNGGYLLFLNERATLKMAGQNLLADMGVNTLACRPAGFDGRASLQTPFGRGFPHGPIRTTKFNPNLENSSRIHDVLKNRHPDLKMGISNCASQSSNGRR